MSLKNPLFLIDFYKACHHEQYPAEMNYCASTYTPRMSRLEDTDHVAFVGAQGIIKKYFIEDFQTYFFNENIEDIMSEYDRFFITALYGSTGAYCGDRIRKLHALGYLPIEIRAVPEGMRTKIGVPQCVFKNTHPDFAWLPNTLETLFSCSMWHCQISAEVGYRYWQIVKKYWKQSCDTDVNPRRLLGDFSMRGQHSVESATKSSAAWLTSFLNTATVPAIMYLEKYYNCDITKEPVGYGAISTEHSVMCSNYAVDGDEITHIKRLLTEIYPNNSFSMVSDSYDYWNLITNILPQCKEEIMNHNGCISIRGDSGDPVEIIAGKKFVYLSNNDAVLLINGDEDSRNKWVRNWFYYRPEKDTTIYAWYNDTPWQIDITCNWSNEPGLYTECKHWFVDDYSVKVTKLTPTPELMGTVWALWQEFGGTINSKGFQVLDPHIRAIYGDSITPQRCEEIYKRLIDQGFAINNVILGVGSFSFMCLETVDSDGNTTYAPYTRDTFGIAIKATYGELDAVNSQIPLMIYKQPKALSWKKSQKGCCIVAPDGESYDDEYTWDEACAESTNLLQPIFCNGKMVKEWTIHEVRNNMYPEGF